MSGIIDSPSPPPPESKQENSSTKPTDQEIANEATSGRTAKKIPFVRKHRPKVDLDCLVLEKTAGVTFNEQQRNRISDLTNTYHRDSINWDQGPGSGEAKDQMEKTAKAADALSALLIL